MLVSRDLRITRAPTLKGRGGKNNEDDAEERGWKIHLDEYDATSSGVPFVCEETKKKEKEERERGEEERGEKIMGKKIARLE